MASGQKKERISRTQATGLVPQGGIVRPFGAHFGISSARTPGIQQKMWDMLRGRREAPHER